MIYFYNIDNHLYLFGYSGKTDTNGEEMDLSAGGFVPSITCYKSSECIHNSNKSKTVFWKKVIQSSLLNERWISFFSSSYIMLQLAPFSRIMFVSSLLLSCFAPPCFWRKRIRCERLEYIEECQDRM